MDLFIRQARLSDLDSIYKIEVISFGYEAFSKEFLLEMLFKFPEFFIVAEKDNKIIGYLSALIEGYFNKTCHLLSIAVLPEYRNRGIGSLLLKHLIDLVKIKGIGSIILEVKKDNRPAISVYEKFGFKIVGYKHRYYRDGSDALVMKLKLV
ncbi:MAG: ribosomal protein S18-alanine N-acetyltransferase [Thermoprotei archaeon]|jgi:ribosomal-protein-alanine N-acetyltransferase